MFIYHNIQKTKFISTTLITLSIILTGCSNQENQLNISTTPSDTNQNLPQVVATTAVLCDLVQQVAEKTINLTCLASEDSQPELYQPTDFDRQAIDQAELILYNGYNFETSLQKLIKSTKNKSPKIAVAQVAVPKPLNHTQAGKIVPDPHVWHNVKNTVKMVDIINNSLKKIAPKNAEFYSNNTQKIKSELNQMDTWVKERVATIPKKQRTLITTHDAMGYYAKAYGLAIPGTLQRLNSNEKVTSTRMKQLATILNNNLIPTIFLDTTTNRELIENVAEEARVTISKNSLFADDLGTPGSAGETYQEMMTANTRTIVEGLGGTYLIFEAK
ncbi:MAG: zinc ABC transporter substrate-binding protein [Scytonematopsis contorta HA4267-MV1]|jgi:ABC-type Zn uptake system ZnuABC Zn-binding protein ZnuA|nr:zinc ABC transporter substrate-binding protein [Scytonematopsis contorta HA4267-MV1]